MEMQSTACCGDGGDRRQGDAAGGFEGDSVGGQPDGLAHLVWGVVVEQGHVGAGFDGLLQFCIVLHLHLELDVRVEGSGAVHGRGDAAGGGNVVLLQEEGIEEPHAVVGRAPRGDGIFLGVAEARQGLARVQDGDGVAGCRARVGDGVAVAPCCGGSGGEHLHEVDDGAFDGEQGARRPREFKEW